MIMRRVWPSRPTFENPFTDLDELRRRMMLRLAGSFDGPAQEPGSGVFPPINVTQDDERFQIRAEVPGIKASELSIAALRNRVSIAGVRQIPPEHERASYHRKERAEGSFNRTVALPSEVDADHVEARYANGILTITLPKAPQAKPRKIEVAS